MKNKPINKFTAIKDPKEHNRCTLKMEGITMGAILAIKNGLSASATPVAADVLNWLNEALRKSGNKDLEDLL